MTTADRGERAPDVDPRHDGVSRMWSGGWQRYVFPAFWLVYLGQTASRRRQALARRRRRSSATSIVVRVRRLLPRRAADGLGGEHRRRSGSLYALARLLTSPRLPSPHQDALVFCVYIAVLTVARTGAGRSPCGDPGAGRTAPASRRWSCRPGGEQVDWATALTVLLVAFAMFGFFQIIQSNRELRRPAPRSPGWPPRTSAPASPATCTTCSATR